MYIYIYIYRNTNNKSKTINTITNNTLTYAVKNKGTLEVTNGYSLCPNSSTLMVTLEIAFVECSVPFTVRIKRHIAYPLRYALNGL